MAFQHFGLNERTLALTKQISGAWVSFARTGNPNHSSLPHWPASDAEKRATMIFDMPCTVRNGPESEGLRLLGRRFLSGVAEWGLHVVTDYTAQMDSCGK
jgi:carboxylesterase type B